VAVEIEIVDFEIGIELPVDSYEQVEIEAF
jgi:hypothetical protein